MASSRVEFWEFEVRLLLVITTDESWDGVEFDENFGGCATCLPVGTYIVNNNMDEFTA